MMKNLFYLSALVCVSLISAESSESSDETYAVRDPVNQPGYADPTPINQPGYAVRTPINQPALRVTQPIMTQPKLSCRLCVRQCLFDDDDASNIMNNPADVADAANEKFNWGSRGFCRQCINRCSRQMCSRMGFLPMIKGHSGADSHHRQLMEK